MLPEQLPYFNASFRTTLLLCLALLFACGEDEDEVNLQDQLEGTWRLTDAGITIDGQDIRQFYSQLLTDLEIPFTDDELDQLEASLNEDLDDAFEDGTTFSFQNDGIFVLDSPDDDEDGQGTWEIVDNDTVRISDGAGTIDFVIASLSDTELRLSVAEEEPVDLGLGGSEEVMVGATFTFVRQ